MSDPLYRKTQTSNKDDVCLSSGQSSHLPMVLHPLSQEMQKEAQVTKWRGYVAITHLQIPKVKLLFRFLCKHLLFQESL